MGIGFEPGTGWTFHHHDTQQLGGRRTLAAADTGAHRHLDPGCLDLAERRRAFGRALRLTTSLDAAEVREYVLQQVPGAIPGSGTVPVPPTKSGRSKRQ